MEAAEKNYFFLFRDMPCNIAHRLIKTNWHAE